MKHFTITLVLCLILAFVQSKVFAFTTNTFNERPLGVLPRQLQQITVQPPNALLYHKHESLRPNDPKLPLVYRTNRRRSTRMRLYSLKSSLASSAAARGVGSYYLVRIIFLRSLAFVYMVAFTVALRQNKGLIGDNGITPARNVLNRAEQRGKEKRIRREEWWDKFKDCKRVSTEERMNLISILRQTKIGVKVGKSLNNSTNFQDLREMFWDRADRLGRPYISLLWALSPKQRNQNMNQWLDGIALAGLSLSSVMFLFGSANVPVLFALWFCQRSLMSVGGVWYGFGWEPQLAELTFHALFLVPVLSLNAIPYLTPVPNVTVWAMRWLLFRIMIGAGLIKLRSGDPKWKLQNLSAMEYFYETQPVPNPITRYFHAMPKWWHKSEVLMNHFVELIAPCLLILPGLHRSWRIMGGVIQLVFQIILISSGNLSFLNWLTMIPALFCLDDAFVSKLFSPKYTTSASIAAYFHRSIASKGIGQLFRSLVNFTFGILITKLSVPVVKNLLSKKQIMNGSFDPLRLVNTYGAFGTVDETREEYIIESAEDISGPWKEYQFKVKPGDVNRGPRFISPYHYRLDWMMWIASTSGGLDRNPWMYSFLLKLLNQERDVLALIASDPWQASNRKPKYIRVEKYRYKFAEVGGKEYWERERIGKVFPRQVFELTFLKEDRGYHRFFNLPMMSKQSEETLSQEEDIIESDNKKITEIPEPKNAPLLQKEYEKLESVISDLGNQLSDVLQKQEHEFLTSYESHMRNVKKNFEDLKDDIDEKEKAIVNNVLVKQLEKERDHYKKEALYLDKVTLKLKKREMELSDKVQELEDERKWLSDNLRAVIKDKDGLEKDFTVDPVVEVEDENDLC